MKTIKAGISLIRFIWAIVSRLRDFLRARVLCCRVVGVPVRCSWDLCLSTLSLLWEK